MSDLFSQEWFENLKANLANALTQSLPVSYSDESIEIAQIVTDFENRNIVYIIKIIRDTVDILFTDPTETTPTLITDYSTYMDLLEGKTDVSNAIFFGKIRVKGDLQRLIANKHLLQAIGTALTAAMPI